MSSPARLYKARPPRSLSSRESSPSGGAASAGGSPHGARARCEGLRGGRGAPRGGLLALKEACAPSVAPGRA